MKALIHATRLDAFCILRALQRLNSLPTANRMTLPARVAHVSPSSSSRQAVTASQARRAMFLEMGHKCPSCDQPCAKVVNLQKHINKCCPDLTDTSTWDIDADEQNVASIIEAAREKELQLRAMAVSDGWLVGSS